MLKFSFRKKNQKSGFTLFEIIIVIIIIGTIAALAMPRLTNTIERSKAGEAAENLTALLAGQNRYKLENGNFKNGTGGGNDLAANDLDLTINVSQNFNTPKIYNGAAAIGANIIASMSSKGSTTYRLMIDTSGKITCDDGVGGAATICQALKFN